LLLQVWGKEGAGLFSNVRKMRYRRERTGGFSRLWNQTHFSLCMRWGKYKVKFRFSNSLRRNDDGVLGRGVFKNPNKIPKGRARGSAKIRFAQHQINGYIS